MSNRLAHVKHQRSQRHNRVRATVSGTAERPRLSVVISNRHVAAQLIDDTASKTIVAASTIGKKSITGTMTEKAQWVGTEIAKQAKSKKINKVVLDRGRRLYHGRVKALADAAREAGLEL